ncbi:MAG TPA: ABC transporter substrate-binding protein, partial [Aggregatilineaceae bacterium]|nr:ABC transporter substrate-binding protein [Aggregatilineaceae bacterium]
FNLAPIGTGPYQMEALTASEGRIDGIQLRVAPVYRQRPEGAEGFALDRIIFRTYPTLQDALDAYQRGEVNSISTIPKEAQTIAQQLPSLSLYTAFEPHVGVLIYNWKRDAVSFIRNQRVRLALAHAVDIPAVVNKNLAGWAIPADSPLVPNSWAYVPGLDRPAYDLARAQELMNTANLEFESSATEEPTPAATTEATQDATEEASGQATAEATAEVTAEVTESAPVPTSLSLTILTLDDPALVALANDIAASWQQIGFTMTVEAVDATTLQTRLEMGDFDAAIVELGFEPSADPDPYVFWHQGQYQTGQNFGGMDDRRVSEALEMARREPYGINRVVHYRRFQELFLERAPALVLYYPLYTYAVDSRIQGIQLGFLSSLADRFRTLQDWSFTDS